MFMAQRQISTPYLGLLRFITVRFTREMPSEEITVSQHARKLMHRPRDNRQVVEDKSSIFRTELLRATLLCRQLSFQGFRVNKIKRISYLTL